MRPETAIDKYAHDRLNSYANLSLNPLTFDQAVELVAARLDAPPELGRLRRMQADRLWPLTDEDIRRVVGAAGCTPRELIGRCAQRFIERQGRPATTTEPEHDLQAVWEERVEESIARSDPRETEHILDDALPMLIDVAASDWSVAADETLPDIDFILSRPHEGRVGVSFCTQENMTSLAGRLRRLKTQREAAHLQKLVLIRDARTPLSGTAKRAQQYLKELQSGDAVFYRPSAEVLAALDALCRLISDADSGDLAVAGRTLAPATVRQWLAEHLACPLVDLRDALLSYPHPAVAPDEDAATRRNSIT